MMKTASLATMIAGVQEPETATAVPVPETEPATDSTSAAAPPLPPQGAAPSKESRKRAPRKARSATHAVPDWSVLGVPPQLTEETDEPDVAQKPKYQTLERRNALLNPGTGDALDRLARQLNAKRSGKGERITANTLTRVAIGLLLEVGTPFLTGTTENEIAQSLGLKNYPGV